MVFTQCKYFQWSSGKTATPYVLCHSLPKPYLHWKVMVLRWHLNTIELALSGVVNGKCTEKDTWQASCKNWPVRGETNRQFFGLQNCVKFVLFEVQSYNWYQNNQTFEHLSWNNPSVWYTWQHSHHGRICPTVETGRFSHNTHHISIFVWSGLFFPFWQVCNLAILYGWALMTENDRETSHIGTAEMLSITKIGQVDMVCLQSI